MKLKTRRRRVTVTLIGCLFAVAAATAIAGAANHGPARSLFTRPDVRVSLDVALQKGNNFVPVPADPLTPGAVLQWTITSANAGDREADQYSATAHIPEGMVIVPGSPTSPHPASVTYSIDKGKTFAALPMVEVKQADNSTKQVPAPTTAYTEVRYQWSDPLPAGQTYVASYKVRVK